MTPSPQSWSVAFSFHTRNCDVQLAITSFVSARDAARLARETPSLVRTADDALLQLLGQEYLVDPSALLVHGDLPSATKYAANEFAFVDGWVFPSPCSVKTSPYAREVARFWLEQTRPSFDRGGLRSALLRHFRATRLARTTETGALDVYESCGKTIDALLDDLLEQQFLVETHTPDAPTIRASTKLLTQWARLHGGTAT